MSAHIPSVHFTRAALVEVSSASKDKARVSAKLDAELVRRKLDPHGPAFKPDRTMFKGKFLWFRPRMIGAVAAYAALTGMTHHDIRKNGGLELFRILWFLGAAQDDLIDAAVAGEGNMRTVLRKAIFGPDRVFYRAAFTVFARELHNSAFAEEAKRYLRRKARGWYRFLLDQEADVLQKTVTDFSFAFCVNYRENQNRMIGELLTACLSWSHCLHAPFKRLEGVLPTLSYRTQIVDDIADIAEDMRALRPSYCIGALVDNPDEFARVKAYVTTRTVGKVTPRLFRRLAPRSYDLVREKYSLYGAELRRAHKAGSFLSMVGDMLFGGFPVIRDVVYRISPHLANF